MANCPLDMNWINREFESLDLIGKDIDNLLRLGKALTERNKVLSSVELTDKILDLVDLIKRMNKGHRVRLDAIIEMLDMQLGEDNTM